MTELKLECPACGDAQVEHSECYMVAFTMRCQACGEIYHVFGLVKPEETD